MCGIIFQISDKKINTENLEKAETFQKHRGPDFMGSKNIIVEEKNLYFSHQRLSILDLSSAANQPMIHEESGSILIFNGEVYNYLELKKDLNKFQINFKTTSDTEVLLYYLIFFGPELTCKKINGMWSFVFYDAKKRKIFFSRDRCGEKPLYYHIHNKNLIVSSELKTLAIASGKKFSLNKKFIYNFLEQSIIDLDDDCILYGIKQFKQGSLYSLDLRDDKIILDENLFWNLEDKEKDFPNLENLIYDHFFESVKIRLRSDVKIGIMLSGGLDSSAIAAVAKKINKNFNFQLLSFISNSKKYDESEFIELMENHLNAKSLKVKLPDNVDQYFELLKEVSKKLDAPLAGASNLAHYYLMKEAKKNNIKVILSGQGADESLCGYKKYLYVYLINLLKKKKFFKFFHTFFLFLKNKTIFLQFDINGVKRYLGKKKESYYGSFFKDVKKTSIYSVGQNLRSRQIDDVKKFSVPSICHYEDRLSMLNSIEVRYPFLDNNLIELFISLNDEKKIYRGWTKYIFRKTFEKLLPKEVTWRKDKNGFSTDFEEKINNQYYYEYLIKYYFNDNAVIFNEKIINKEYFLNIFNKFYKSNDKRLSSKKIFSIISLEEWLQNNKSILSYTNTLMSRD
jgi:asparagine synthase (glutamine-hydrolysing)